MKIENLLINLKSPVDAFSIKPRHIETIRSTFPDTVVTVTEDSKVFREKLAEADCVLTWVFKPDWYAEAVNLKAVYTPAAGHDWVAADPSGRVKTWYGCYHGKIMRESLLSMMLYFNRNIQKSLNDKQNKVWGRFGYNDCAALFSQRVLIIGFGSLGQSMAELLTAFGARIIAVKRNLSGFENHPHAERVITYEQLPDELPLADHVVLLLPGGRETEGVFTESHFKAMKQGAYLYNLGRGTCYSEEHLVAALRDGRVAGAGLDVFAEEPLPETSPLWEMPNVLLTPHSSAISREYIDLFIQEWIGRVNKL
jgi:D-2-hydroxyacid dehydrogenase (NADP+)